MKRVERYASHLAVLFIDVDSFKQVNDSYVYLKLSGLEKNSAAAIRLLEESGLDSIEKIAASSVEDLTKIKGIGEKTAAWVLRLLKRKMELYSCRNRVRPSSAVCLNAPPKRWLRI